MRFPVPPRARPTLGLLLLTLLLGAVCGVPVTEPESPKAPPGNPLRKAQEDREEEGDQQPQGMAGAGPTPVTPSSLLYFLVFSNMKYEQALPVTDFSHTVPWEDEQEEDGAKKPHMHHWEQEESEKSYPGFKSYNPDGDGCYKWVSCNYDFYTKYLRSLQSVLPSCPCTYPAKALDGVVSLLDRRLGRPFSWKDARDTEDLEDGRHPSAGLCLRSLWTEDSSTLAAQLCCYDGRGRLLTRGKGAGSPELISADFSPELHFMVDHNPWESCKGDWSIFHTLLPPDNGLSCPQRPSRDKHTAQLMELSE